MRIVFCHHYSMSFWSGGEKQIAYLAQKLLSDGFDVEICSLPVRNKDIKPVLGNVKYSEKWFHNIDADVAYFLYSPYIENFFKFNGKKTKKIAAIRGFPLIPEIQHRTVEKLSPVAKLKEMGLARSLIWWHSKYMRNLENFDAIHVQSSATVKLFKEFNKKIYDIPNWVDIDFYNPCKNKREEFTVLFAGRNEWVKGIDIYNEIAKIAERKGLGIKFLATGDKINKNGKRNKKNGSFNGSSNGNFNSLGFIPDNMMPSIYSEVHSTINPTRIDTFGNTILESLACGTPVITTKIPVHEAMQLPTLYDDSTSYADTAEEFLEKIIELNDMWNFRKDCYYRLCSKCRESTIRYNFKEIYPKFINMFYGV